MAGLIHMCRTLKVLPRAGGLLDQDSLYVYLAEIYELSINEKAALEKKRQEAQAKRQR